MMVEAVVIWGETQLDLLRGLFTVIAVGAWRVAGHFIWRPSVLFFSFSSSSPSPPAPPPPTLLLLLFFCSLLSGFSKWLGLLKAGD